MVRIQDAKFTSEVVSVQDGVAIRLTTKSSLGMTTSKEDGFSLLCKSAKKPAKAIENAKAFVELNGLTNVKLPVLPAITRQK